jgi:hypothetical protein
VLTRLSSRLTYANVIATVALFLALGGGAYAAFKLPKNSVGTKQIKNKAVTLGKISGGAQGALRGHNGRNGANGTNGRNGTSGTNGTTIVGRARGSGPAATSNSFQSSSLSGNAWAQGSNEVDTVVGQATIQEPSSIACTAFFGAIIPGELTGQLLVDGNVVGTINAVANGATQTLPFTSGNPYVFEPGVATNHSVTAQFEDNCGQGGNGAVATTRFDVTNVSVDVEGAR